VHDSFTPKKPASVAIFRNSCRSQDKGTLRLVIPLHVSDVHTLCLSVCLSVTVQQLGPLQCIAGRDLQRIADTLVVLRIVKLPVFQVHLLPATRVFVTKLRLIFLDGRKELSYLTSSLGGRIFKILCQGPF
jgi:hypothetical protein